MHKSLSLGCKNLPELKLKNWFQAQKAKNELEAEQGASLHNEPQSSLVRA